MSIPRVGLVCLPWWSWLFLWHIFYIYVVQAFYLESINKTWGSHAIFFHQHERHRYDMVGFPPIDNGVFFCLKKSNKSYYMMFIYCNFGQVADMFSYDLMTCAFSRFYILPVKWWLVWSSCLSLHVTIIIELLINVACQIFMVICVFMGWSLVLGMGTLACPM